jgi:NlpC/P60 family putative phage cell wall peptidase
MNRDHIVQTARQWIGTPFRHQASLQGVGADCLGLLRGVWRSVIGPEPEMPPPYTADWGEASGQEILLNALRRHFIEIRTSAAQTGDVLVFRMALDAPAKHCAILSAPDRIVHAYWGHGVAETRLGPWWQRRVIAAFQFPDRES